MTFKRLTAVLTASVAMAGLCLAQKPKSQKEYDAVVAIQSATDFDARIAAVENLLTKFADTEFKVIALEMAADAARMKRDSTQTIVYCERAIEADPENLVMLSMLARTIADSTGEHDLDKEDKLKRVESLAKKTIDLAPAAKNKMTVIPEDQFQLRVKDSVGQAHEALAASAFLRKKNDVAIEEYKKAIESASQPDPTTMIRLAIVYNAAKQYDEAIAVLDKAIATTDNPQIKQVAAQEKVKAATAKAAQKK